MNERKRAWQLIHTAIRRHAGVEPSGDWRAEIETVIKEADSEVDLIAHLVSFSAVVAFWFGHENERVVGIVDSLNDSVMNEDDSGPPSF